MALDAFTQTVWSSWGAINALTMENFKCIDYFIRLTFYNIFFKHTNKCWNNAMILLNMTKPPVGGGKCLFSWVSHLLMHSTDSFKWLINLETRQVTVLMNGPLNHWLTQFIQNVDSFCNETALCCLETQQFSCGFDWILGRCFFYFNYCLNSAWNGGDQFVALLRWYGSPDFFDSGLQFICIFWSLVSHFPLDNAP